MTTMDHDGAAQGEPGTLGLGDSQTHLSVQTKGTTIILTTCISLSDFVLWFHLSLFTAASMYQLPCFRNSSYRFAFAFL